jgi:hypothetical protein
MRFGSLALSDSRCYGVCNKWCNNNNTGLDRQPDPFGRSSLEAQWQTVDRRGPL